MGHVPGGPGCSHRMDCRLLFSAAFALVAKKTVTGISIVSIAIATGITVVITVCVVISIAKAIAVSRIAVRAVAVSTV